MSRLYRKMMLALAMMVLFVVPSYSQTLYGITNGFGTAADNLIYQINPANGAITNSVQVTLPGFTVERSLSLAAQPGTGTLFAILQTSVDTATNRRLVTIDPMTGVATNIGLTGGSFATLAFRQDGVLYGATGQAGSNPESLFTLSVLNATPTFQFAMGNGDDGETIAFHGNGLMYHSSGNNTALFESVNVNTQVITPIGSASGEMFAMGYDPTSGLLFGSDIGNNLFTIDIATGARTFIDNMADSLPSDNRGLAFVAAVPEPSTMVLAGAGGLVGVWVLRKRNNAEKRHARLAK